jgi:hypothetical protein
MFKPLLIGCAFVVIASAVAPVARADTPSCVSTAAGKKLAGAAKTSFMTKCQKDAAAQCDATAADKKIYGAAKASFTKKCVSDAVGK